MTISVAQFRADYPEFASSVDYTTPALTYWLNVAYQLLVVARWGSMLDIGAELFVAHNIVLEAQAQRTAEGGGLPGLSSGIVSSKNVDSVSVGYDTTAGIEKDAGNWNLTIYGTRFIKLAKMFGAGPQYIGVGIDPTGGNGAWSGPNVTPGFSNFG